RFNPYDLTIVDFLEIDKQNFYTLSAKGVTHFVQGKAEFTALHQWIREYHLFNKIIKIPFFSKYRSWKCFTSWRKHVRGKKIDEAKKYLTENLFIVDSRLCKPLLEVRKVCQNFKFLRFHAIQKEITYDLPVFIKQHEDSVKHSVSNLNDFRSQVEKLISDCCEECIKSFTLKTKEQFESSYSKRSSSSSSREKKARKGSSKEAMEPVKMVYTERAAKRKMSFRLQRFVKMSDYLVVNALQAVSISSMNDLVVLLFRHFTDENVVNDSTESNQHFLWTLKTSTLIDIIKQESFLLKTNKTDMQKKMNHDSPMFRTEITMNESTLEFLPSYNEFLNGLEKISKSFVNILENFTPLCSSVTYIDKKELLDEASFSDGPNVFEIVLDDVYFQVLFNRMKGVLSGNFNLANHFAHTFDQYVKMFNENLTITMESIESQDLSLEFFEGALKKYTAQRKEMESIQTSCQVGNMLIDSVNLQKLLLPSPIRCFNYLEVLLPKLAHSKNEKLLVELNESIRILKSNPMSVESFVDNLHHLDYVKSIMASLEDRIEETVKFYSLVEEYNVNISPTELALYQTLVPTSRQLKDCIEIFEDAKEENIQKFSFELEKNVNEMLAEVNDIKNKAQDSLILNPTSASSTVINYIDDLLSSLNKQQKLSDSYISYQKDFKMTASKFTEVDETLHDLTIKKTLWTSFEEFDSLVKNWREMPFEKLDIEDMNNKILSYLKTVVQVEKGLPPNEVVPKLRSKVEEFRQIYPTIVDLRNQALKPRHWEKIQEVIGKVIAKDETFTLGNLNDMNVFLFKEDISAISAQASSEAALEEMLSKVQKTWGELEFTVLPYRDYKDVFILGGVDEIGAQLEDSQVIVATIRGSRHNGPIKNEVERWDKQLALFSETLEEWIACQRSWLYLETIFSAPDIQRQLPEESKMFSQVDKSWKDIMRKTSRNPLAIKAGTVSGLLETMQQNNQLLEKIQKCLEEYLESKRLLFPRAYFLSNDELIEILSQTRNPLAVQPHLSKCFDAIKSLEFSSEPKSIDILAMMSPEGERLAFIKTVKARGNVESWLSSVEDGMYNTVRKAIKTGLAEYERMPRDEWILSQPGQIVLAVSQIIWCRDVTECLKSNKVLSSLQKYKDKCVQNLIKLATMVRGNLSRLNRGKLGALITIEVHARDILIGLINSRVNDQNDFEWNKQLRYYWDAENDSCVVKMTNSTFEYGYEYLGCSPRLVITPLTDRCYMTLTSAIQLNLGGSPLGPAGTGKTETVKDLAKAVARQCVVFNCSDALDYKMMGKFFAGLAQSGAWACFDEFNRINVEVLSVVAQQLLTIKRAKDAKVHRFIFEGKDIRLIQTCNSYITMNPGYAGRTELPDNLKALFRPIAMMIPDYALIAEIILFSEGFENAKILSRKLVNLYKLCSEQLSQQDHYDFGMRAVKSTVNMAGALKRASPNLNEDVALIRSLRDSNLPKFLADDIPLFKGILNDLFPAVTVPPLDYGVLLNAIQDSMTERKLDIVPAFVERVIQLYETMKVRHGVMLVGPTGSGKTTNYEILASALTKLKERDPNNPDYQKVRTFVLNPKCITMAELYGEFNLATMEWKDGLMGNIVRAQVSDTTSDEKWIVCDGPVDALWIENMNTVLDDNKLLCLTNGERIKLNNTIHMVFEVSDLAVASPATVSRCGMVYLDPMILGWQPYVKKWMKGLPDYINDEHKEVLMSFFDQFVDVGLKFVRKNCKEYISTVNVNLVASLCKILETQLERKDEIEYNQSTADLKSLFGYIFSFAYIWSIGGNLADGCHDSFDTFARETLDNNIVSDFSIPSQQSVYSYYVDFKKKRFQPWDELVPSFSFDQSVPFFQIMVPTVDTVRYSFFLEYLINHDHPTLISGTTGVGKSFMIMDCLNKLTKNRGYLQANLNFSAQTTSAMTQQILELKLEKKRKNILGAPNNSKIVMFIDDLNMPKKDTYGSQPPLELVRQYLDFGGVYDRDKLFWKKIQDVVIIGACAPPGGGRNTITQRLIRHFNVFSIATPSEVSQVRIFKSIVEGFLEKFESDVQTCIDAIVSSSVEIYKRMCSELLPTPNKSHYTFNMRDLSKVIQGITQAKPNIIKTRVDMTRLFCHECSRVFHDRLIDFNDKSYFYSILSELTEKNFGQGISKESMVEDPIIFGDFMKRGASQDDKNYEEIKDKKVMENVLEDYLEEYNTLSSKQMRLIFFMDAKQHLSRISRVINQPRGNALLVGVGGTGKQSLTRLACHICEYRCIQIELTRTYGTNEWREDIKRLYRFAGLEGKNTVFLISDTQFKSESFLEDINSILNTGEIPNLFDFEERERILGELRQKAKDKGYGEDRDSVQQFFINRVRDNLHIVLAMSPVGESFRNRCRMFPSLVNCCTIDWFDVWPKEALLSVSSRFLEFVDLGQPELKNKIAEMCVEIHTSVQTIAEQFYQELRRRYYTTPTSYLELINLYTLMLSEKKRELVSNRDRLKNGLNKLQETNEIVAKMQIELENLKPELKQKAEDVEVLISQISKDQQVADGVKKTVREEEAIVKEKAVLTEQIAADAQKDLDEALPALEAAYSALDNLDKKDVAEMKAFTKPPELVMTVMEAVCILFKVKPDWESSKKLLSDSQFLKNMMSYDKDNIPEAVIKKIKKYIDNPVFTPENVEKVSKACKSMCMWVRAMDIYARVFKEVVPKKKKLEDAQLALEEMKSKLQEKANALAQVESQLKNLKQKYETSLASKKNLQDKMAETSNRLTRASKLTSALAEEQVRWTESVKILDQEINDVVGNIFLAAAGVAYFGAFTSSYRLTLGQKWVTKCQELGIPVSSSFNLTKQLGDQVLIREWNLKGLPNDDLSIENGILVSRGRRWPLMIDPSGQANRWIRNMEMNNGLKIIKLNDPKFLRNLENAIRLGNPVLLEDVGETLDPALEPLLLKQTFKQGGRVLIRLGDADVDYDKNFRFYMTTKLSNPHYLPEVCIKVTIINFTVTKVGLTGQLLGDVVKLERPDLEEQRNNLILSMAEDKKQLKEIEEKILKLLYNSQGNILDDEELIDALNQSKVTSAAIQERVQQAEKTEAEINLAREAYLPVSIRGSILYFIISDLSEIDPMYQFSLKYFKNLFNSCIINTPKSDILDQHILDLCENITISIFNNVSRGLFEQHKLIFSFLICIEILKEKGLITDAEWNFFLRGNVSIQTKPPPKPEISWLTESIWKSIFDLSQTLPQFKQSFDLISNNPSMFNDFMDSQTPFKSGLPVDVSDRLTSFNILILIKILREESVIGSTFEFIKENLGSCFVDPVPFDLAKTFEDTSITSPLIFVLSPGSDPISALLKYAKDVGYSDKLTMISLGQGQGTIAEELIKKATNTGEWVFLQNCHLAASWMPRFENIVKEFSSADAQIHPNFRLIVSSMPSKVFPISILQDGVKVTNEPPRGLRANLQRFFLDISNDVFDKHPKLSTFRTLLFGISFFNAIIHERKKFGPLGWNIPYDWSNSDLEVAVAVLSNTLAENDSIQWDSLRYMTDEIIFGGRVTDDWDRRTLKSILQRFYTPKILEKNYKFCSLPFYYAPEGDLSLVRSFIDKLPLTEEPEIFGMHQNANISFQLQETKRLIQTVVDVQPRLLSGSAGKSPDEIVLDLASSMLSDMPLLLNPELIPPERMKVDSDGRLENCLLTVLIHESHRFNKLLQIIVASLENLIKAVKGLVVMSSELDLVFYSLLNNQVPLIWSNAAYPSLKPLASWFKDLQKRVQFMADWIEKGQPKSFWLSGFFYPQGFLTGILQNYARKNKIAIDELSFSFSVLSKDANEISDLDIDDDGTLVHGLYLEGARWDNEKKLLQDSLPMQMYCPMPVIKFIPTPQYTPNSKLYECPLYKTSARAGTLSTTGQSTNYVLAAFLNSDKPSEYWISRGVALLCQLNE
ncbi:dynein heavy chain 6, axonemal, partial [Rozella allomycis CSF55]